MDYTQEDIETGILSSYNFYDSQQQIYQYEQQIKHLFENINLDSRRSSLSNRFNISLLREDKELLVPLFKIKQPRKTFNIITSQKERTKNILKSNILKKWSQVIKMILKESIIDWSSEQRKFIQQFYFTLNINIDHLRKLFGFQKVERANRLIEVDDCRRIRQYLFSMVDSSKIVDFIERSKSSIEQRKELVMMLGKIRELILDPTIQMVIG